MRILPLALTAFAVALPASAQAQYWRGSDYRDYREYQRDVRQASRECRRDLRRADTRREYNRARRECRRELREARRDYRRDLRDNYGYYDRSYGYYNRGYSGYYQPRHYGQRYWDGYRWRYRY
jgi:hypothetical protein